MFSVRRRRERPQPLPPQPRRAIRDGILARLALGLVVAALAACSGSGGDDDGGPDPANAPPAVAIAAPAEGATYKAGDRIAFRASATDREDGALAAASLAWWVEFHHDTHTHPFVQRTTGASGTLDIPTRFETADNVWFRIHVRAVDSEGRATELTRDVLPQKSRFTLDTEPAGLQLTLDGQPVTAPHRVTGVIGIERDLGAADQVADGRRWRFSHWSDGGSARHTISTPASARTYTASFVDAGPAVNAPPTVAITAPANGSAGVVGTPIVLTARAADSDGRVARVQFYDGAAAIGAADTGSPWSVEWTPESTGEHRLTARAVDDSGAATTSAAVTVTVTAAQGDTRPPTVAITAPAAFADDLSGNVTFSADASDASGVASVEFQLDGQPLATDRDSPYRASFDASLHARGQRVLRVRATDTAGNRSSWVTRIVRTADNELRAPAGITRTLGWVRGIEGATAFTQLPDGRLLVALQPGQLRVVQPDGTLLAQPMLPLPNVDTFGERGLLGVTPHPDFASNGFIYVYYTTTQGGSHNRISRFRVSGNTAGPESVLVNLPPLGPQLHNAGALHFGADGSSYVAVGDNFISELAQDLDSVFGKVLRLDDDGSIPNDNPHCTTAGRLACAVWARGLRNPFTMAVQPGTGRIFINDVGNHTWEEVNEGKPGANFGWPTSEGPERTQGFDEPLFTYRHTATAPPGTGIGAFIDGTCVIGGGFYPESGPFPAKWRGGYFFADLGREFVAFVDLKNDNAVYGFGRSGSRPVGMLVARDGALLVLTQLAGITRFAVD